MKITFLLVLVILLLGTNGQEKYEFVAEVGRVMDIIINSLYTQKQIFLRQLISNASDALDKIRLLALQNPDILGSQTQLQIKIQYDEDKKILEIVDNGVGMTKNELIHNLGTVAKSGTATFLQSVQQSQQSGINLIGQFGVGFYSSFLVGSTVQVISKHNDDDHQYKWSSSASNSFSVQQDDSVKINRGTIVRLHLKQDAEQFCKYEQLQKLIQRYSSFINYPIYLQKKVFEQQKIQKTQAQIEEERQKIIKKYQEEGKEIDEDQIEESINRTTTRLNSKIQFERMNENQPLWLRDRDKITKQEYEDFYKAVFKDQVKPLTWNHFNVQGSVDFTSLMFVPERASYDQFQKFFEKKSEVKLYVRRVLINDQFEQLMPKYLNFLKVMVDSNSLPLNVNRQNLQQDKSLKTIGQKLTKKAVEMLVSFNPGTEEQQQFDSQQSVQEGQEQTSTPYQKKVKIFNKFWENFSKNLKYGMIEDSHNREKLAVLSRWHTTYNVTGLSSLDEIIERMVQGQKHLYFLGGQSSEIVAKSPLIQRLVQEGYEVIIGNDPLDQTLFSQFRQYKGYKIINVARNDFKQPYKTDQLRKQVKYLTKIYQPLIDYAKQELKTKIKDVKVSMRLVNTPVVIVTDMMNDTPNKQRIESATAMKGNMYFQRQKNILEINPHDPIIQQLNKIVQDEPTEGTAQLIQNLYHAALIHSGFLVKDPFVFSKSVFGMINTAFEVKDQINTIQVSQEDIDIMQAQEEKQQKKSQEAPGIEIPADAKIVGGAGEQVLDLDDQNSNDNNDQPEQQQQSKEEQDSAQNQNEQQNSQL